MADCSLELVQKYRDLLDPESIQSIISNVEEYKNSGSSLFGPETQALKSRLEYDFKKEVHRKVFEKVDEVRFKQWYESEDFKKTRSKIRSSEAFKNVKSQDPKVRSKAAKEIMESGIFDPIISRTSGLTTAAFGGNRHYDQIKNVKAKQFLQLIEKEVGDDLKVLSGGDFDLDIARAVTNLNTDKPINSFPMPVQKAANAIVKTNKLIVKDLQSVGTWLPESSNYITKQTHDVSRIQDFGVDNWVNELVDNNMLDEMLTFGKRNIDRKEKVKILKKIYSDIATGKYGSSSPGQFTSAREIHFSSPDNFVKYNNKFGRGSLMNTVTASAQSASKVYARTEMFGTNPTKTLNDMKNRIKKFLPPEVKEMVNETTGFSASARMNKEIKEILGESQYPVTKSKAVQALQTSKILQAGAKLKWSVFSTATDFGFGNYFKSAGLNADFVRRLKTVPDFFKSFTNKQNRRQLEDITGMYFGDLVENSDKYGAFSEGGSNKIIDFTRKYVLPFNLMQRQNAAAKLTWGKLAVTEMGHEASKSFDQLNPRLQQTLNRYGFDADKWEKIRQNTSDFEGTKILGPDDIADGTGDTRLADDYSLMINDIARTASPEVGIRERALITQGFERGTVARESMTTLAQFKTFPLTMNRVIDRTINNNPEIDSRGLKQNIAAVYQNKGEMWLLGATMAEMTMLAAVSQLTREAITQGQTRDLSDPEALISFMGESAQRTALPLFSSYLVDIAKGEYSKFGRSMFRDLAGPTAGEIDKMVGVLSGTLNKKEPTFLQGTELVLQYLPGNQLMHIAPLGMKSFFQNMKELQSPGYMDRLEKRRRKEGKIKPDFLNPFR